MLHTSMKQEMKWHKIEEARLDDLAELVGSRHCPMVSNDANMFEKFASKLIKLAWRSVQRVSQSETSCLSQNLATTN